MLKYSTVLLFLLLLCFYPASANANEPLVIFAGSASQPPLEEAVEAFQAETGIPVTLHLGGSGAMLNQIRLTRQGDLYIPGSPDYMETAKKLGLVNTEEAILAYLVPAIIVAKGNPLGIRGLEDLARPGVRVGIAEPNGVCVGLYAVEILETNQMSDKIRPNLRGMVESCAKVAAMIPLKLVDAVLGWREFTSWSPSTMDAIMIDPGKLPRLANIPAATLRHSRNKKGAEDFVAFLQSDKGQAIFRKWGYFTDEINVRKFAPLASIGGTFVLTEGW